MTPGTYYQRCEQSSLSQLERELTNKQARHVFTNTEQVNSECQFTIYISYRTVPCSMPFYLPSKCGSFQPATSRATVFHAPMIPPQTIISSCIIYAELFESIFTEDLIGSVITHAHLNSKVTTVLLPANSDSFFLVSVPWSCLIMVAKSTLPLKINIRQINPFKYEDFPHQNHIQHYKFIRLFISSGEKNFLQLRIYVVILRQCLDIYQVVRLYRYTHECSTYNVWVEMVLW